MSRIACLLVVLCLLCGCQSTRQGVVISVETRVLKQELADYPTTLRLEYRLGEQLQQASKTDKERAAR